MNSDNPYASPQCYGPRRRWWTWGRCVWLAIRASIFVHIVCIAGQLWLMYKGGVTVFGVAMILLGLFILYTRPWSFADLFLEPQESPRHER